MGRDWQGEAHVDQAEAAWPTVHELADVAAEVGVLLGRVARLGHRALLRPADGGVKLRKAVAAAGVDVLQRLRKILLQRLDPAAAAGRQRALQVAGVSP